MGVHVAKQCGDCVRMRMCMRMRMRVRVRASLHEGRCAY